MGEIVGVGLISHAPTTMFDEAERGELFSDYENATGTGQVHVWFERPDAGWTG